jgi:hypothetical protein
MAEGFLNVMDPGKLGTAVLRPNNLNLDVDGGQEARGLSAICGLFEGKGQAD